MNQLSFALKHEGLNIPIVKHTLKKVPRSDVIRFVSDLDPAQYYVGLPKQSSRHRVIDNLLGSSSFCPIVLRTPTLQHYEASQLDQAARSLVHAFDPAIIGRAMRYLYTKETMASWEIERERPDKSRIVRFSSLLQRDCAIGELSERTLVDLQKEIVDPRFAEAAYRDFQNYVGEEPSLNRLIVHYISPRPEDVPAPMDGLLHAYEGMIRAGISPVIATAILSFGVVFIHPFLDGNGRLHRFLIHYALARLGFSPPEVVFPVSAVMLREGRAYDTVLEAFSIPLMKLITDWHVDDFGSMTVQRNWTKIFEPSHI